MNLRDNGIYVLPDATEVVVKGSESGYELYAVGSWGTPEAPLFEIDSEGKILRYGRATRWNIDDLGDTGSDIR